MATVRGPGETKRQPRAAEVERAYSVPDGLTDATIKRDDVIPVPKTQRLTLLASSVLVFVLTFLLADVIQQEQEPDYTPCLISPETLEECLPFSL